LERADKVGKSLVPLGTPVNCGEISEVPTDRNRIQNRVVGESFRYARYCAGTHFHFEKQPDNEVDQFNTLLAVDPALALVNSSPYFDGKKTADGARSKLYRWMAYNGVPHQGRLWRYIDSTDEWERRLERRYEEFYSAALEAGFDRKEVEANFDPESSVWTPVQIRDEFGTVEWRSPDTALPSDILRLADEMAEVIEKSCTRDVSIGDEVSGVSEDGLTLPRFDRLLVYLEDSIREGVASDDVVSYLNRMGFEVKRYSPVSHEMEHKTVTRTEARRIRLNHARRLEKDIRHTGQILGG